MSGENPEPFRAGGDNNESAFAYCLDELRREDRDRYLTLLFAPRPTRPALAALYSFNLECARGVTAGGEQPLLGQMRLQWWRDALATRARRAENVGGDAARDNQPVLTLLPEDPAFVAQLSELITAREGDLTGPPFATLDDVVAHACATGGALVTLAAEALGARQVAGARAAGTAYALAGMLRAVPYQFQERGFQGRLCLPEDLLVAHDLAIEDIRLGNKATAVAACMKQVAAAAQRELDDLNAGDAAISPLLHGTLARAYLHRLAGAGYDPYAPDLGLNPLARPLNLLWRSIVRRP